MSFNTPVDICNRAAQHCGVKRITAFTDDSKQAAEFSFVYDKLRRAELRRNVWQFATKKAALRPVTTGTMFLDPELWSSTTTYGFGSVVSDSSGFLWQSFAQDNLGNTPGNSVAWDAYFGPLTVQPYDSTGTTGYFAGELVYETPGDGSYLVYLSLQSGNSQDPAALSEWETGVSYSKDQMVVYFAPWVIGTSYAAGAVVSYNGNDYVSLVAANVGHEPDVTAQWTEINAALTSGFYNSTVSYTSGTIIRYLGINYVALQNNNLANTPSSSAAWWAPMPAGTTYVSLIDFNLNNNPSATPAMFSLATNYAVNQQVVASNGLIYTATRASIAENPTLTNGFWTTTGAQAQWTTVDNFGSANDQWMQLFIGLQDLQIIYPIGAGPAYQSQTKNVYRLPANFLRKAPQDPKAGSVSFLGAPTGLMPDDWNMDGVFIVSQECYPIVLRFVADVTNVSAFDDMFCEGLGARIAIETVEILSQSTTKKMSIETDYKQFMTDARTVNGIETGSDEPPEDDYITCRI